MDGQPLPRDLNLSAQSSATTPVRLRNDRFAPETVVVSTLVGKA
jgi:hypothetical protein